MSSTKNYEKFKFLDFNREKVNERHVGQLKTSIQKNGYLASNPIVVNNKMEIIDGQHRFTACKQLGLPIHYKIIDEKEDIIITLNNTQKKWTINDYINYYSVKHGNQDYIRLQRLCKDLNIGATVVFSILGSTSNGGLSDRIRRGVMTFSKEDELKVYNFYDRIKIVADSIRQKPSSRFVEGIINLSRKEGFEWETMIHKARKYSTKAYSCITKEDFMIMLRDLYNYNARNEKNKIQ